MTSNCAPLPKHHGNRDWPCSGIDKPVSLTGPHPWGVACKNNHYLECVLLPITLGTAIGDEVMVTPLHLAEEEEGCCFKFQVTKAGNFLEYSMRAV